MGKQILKILGSLLAIVLIAITILTIVGGEIAGKTYFYTAPFYEVPTNPATLARGEHLVKHVAGCTNCHGENLAGASFMNAGIIAKIPAPNLTKGIGGVGNRYTPDLYARLLRHGVKADGTGAMLMPIADYQQMSQQDMAAIIAYVRSVPRVEGIWSQQKIGVLGRILLAVGRFPPPAPKGLNHTDPFPITPPPEGATVAYGAYLGSIACTGCHGKDLSGGAIAGGDPNDLVPPSLIDGSLAGWDANTFALFLRTGVTPTGQQVANADMPWQSLAGLSDDEVLAIWLWVQA